jgi:hypothetical protein
MFVKNLQRQISGPTEEDQEEDGPSVSWAYCTVNIVKAIESRRSILMGHVACTRCKNPCKIMVENPEGKRGDGRPVL